MCFYINFTYNSLRRCCFTVFTCVNSINIQLINSFNTFLPIMSSSLLFNKIKYIAFLLHSQLCLVSLFTCTYIIIFLFCNNIKVIIYPLVCRSEAENFFLNTIKFYPTVFSTLFS